VNRLITGIRQGEALTLPCRHCASVSIRFVVEAGLKFMKCPKCGEFTSIQAGLRPEGYEFHSRAVLKGDAGIMA
jgi:phage FluMu protein Com